MIDFWNGIHTPDGAVWFNRFTNEYEFKKRRTDSMRICLERELTI
jgi:hypothetical protein